MCSLADVARLALALPESQERADQAGLRSWVVRKLMFVWERPLRKSDLDALGGLAPSGPIIGVRVADLDEKEALLATEPGYCFTTPHFDGYSAVLVSLETIDKTALEELITDAWLTRAPKRLAAAYLANDV